MASEEDVLLKVAGILERLAKKTKPKPDKKDEKKK